MPVEALPKNKFGLRYTVKYAGLFRPPKLDHGALTNIGRDMVTDQKRRWAAAINADGNPAKRLSLKYRAEKRAFTLNPNPKRDMKMTGRTLANFQLRKAIDNTIRAENTTVLERQKAMRAQQAQEMIGFAPSDFLGVWRGFQREYGRWARKAWVQIR